jgi:hypothetical protein
MHLGFASRTVAQDPSDEAIAAAERDVEIAEIEYRKYLNVEYPTRRQELESQMILSAAEIEVNRRFVCEYERMSRGKTSQVFLVTLADARLALLKAELQYEHLDAEKSRLENFHGDQCRLYELRLDAARARLAELTR